AARRPIPGGHTIWEIVRHLTVWNEVPRRRIDGEPLQDLPAERDWPPAFIETTEMSEPAWRTALADLEASHAPLHARVRDLSDAQLDDPVAGSDPTLRGMLLGILQHNAYHAGQIALLKKGSRP